MQPGQQWLRLFAIEATGAIAARASLAAKPNGNHVHRMTDFHGDARLHTKTV